ncbi:MAG: 5'/3'-nucleotidase SurE, partial [Verrucomicrobiota bacterium]
VVEDVSARELTDGEFWNVNFPHPAPGDSEPELLHCEQERLPLDVGFEEISPGSLLYQGDYHGRGRREGSDVATCFGGDIAVSRVSV